MICNIVRIAPVAMGMFVLDASDGEQALELSRKFPGAIHGLVSNIVMPKLDGLGLCDQIPWTARDQVASDVGQSWPC